jgi:hypothetical protein
VGEEAGWEIGADDLGAEVEWPEMEPEMEAEVEPETA